MVARQLNEKHGYDFDVVENKELLQTSGNTAKATIESFAATHYLFQTGIKLIDSTQAIAGVVAWWKDENNWIRILLNSKTRCWTYVMAERGKQRTASFHLPKDFRFSVYHTPSVYKAGTPFPVKVVLMTGFAGAGKSSIFTVNPPPFLYTESV